MEPTQEQENLLKDANIGGDLTFAPEQTVIYNYYYEKNSKVTSADSTDIADDNLLCPYRGLFHFSPDDAEFFFGREVFVEELFQATENRNYIPVLGASGSGKSSVVLAGLVPKLEQEGHWKFTHFRPGTDPFHALALALVPLYTPELDDTDQIAQTRKLANYLQDETFPLSDVLAKIQQNYFNHRILLIADQFEELYTQCSDPTVRRRFLDCLLTSFQFSNSGASSSTVLVTTMRADFLANALGYRPFADMLQNQDIKLGAMSREELKEVIEKPAEKLGVTFEAGLVERMLNDVEDEPGNLPLLEFALTELWEKREGKQLTHDAYDAIGQVKGALADYADDKYKNLTADEQEQTRRIFIQLVRPGEGTEDTRRRANREELGEENWDLITRKKGLADSRLVVTSRNDNEQDTVEVVHEALIQNWGQLREWMETDRKFRVWQDQLRVVLHQWESTNQDEGALLRGAPLVEAEDWQQKRQAEISDNEKVFIRASVSLRDKEKRERERRRKNLILGLTGGLLGALFLAGFAGWQWRKSQIGQVEALSSSSKALFSTDQVASLIEGLRAAKQLKQVFGVNADTQAKVKFALIQAIFSIREQNRLEKHKGIVNKVRFSPNGEMLASVSGDGTLRLWSIDGRELKVIWGHKSRLLDVNFSPDGKMIASAGEDGSVKLWTLEGKEIDALIGHQEPITSFGFSPDGQMIVSGGEDGSIKLRNLEGQDIFTIKGHGRKVSSVSFSPDGTIIASGSNDGSIKLWNLIGQEIRTIKEDENEINSVSFSPDGTIIASAYENGTVKLWNLDGNLFETLTESRENTKIRTTFRRSTVPAISSLSFSPDGEMIVIGNSKGIIKLWNREKEFGSAFTLLGTHKDRINNISFSSDGTIIASASADGSIKLWNSSGVEPYLLEPNGSRGPVEGIKFNSDGKMIVSGDAMRMLRIWHLPSRRENTLVKEDDVIRSVDFSPSGKTVVSASDDGTIKLWDLENQEVVAIAENKSRVNILNFNPNGKTIALGNADGTIKIWNIKNNKLDIIGEHSGGTVHSLSFSPDGKTIVSGSGDGIIKLWNQNGKKLKDLKGHLGGVNSVSFSPDGTMIASGGSDSTIKLWNLSGQELTTLWGQNGSVDSVSFSPDGTMIASNASSTVKLWLLGDPEPIAIEKEKDGLSFILDSSDLRFSSDGKMIALGQGDGSIKLWNIDIDNLQSQGCQWIHNYLKTSSNVREEDRNICDGVSDSSQMLIDKGRELALEGDVHNAIIEFQKAVNLDSSLEINPEKDAQQIAVEALFEQADNLFQEGDFEGSVAQLKKSLELEKEIDPSLDFEPETRAKIIIINNLIEGGEELLKQGNIEESNTAYIEAQKLEPTSEILLGSSFSRCRTGSLYGYAEEVINSCDKLVELEPEPGRFKGIRGIARTMSGDFEGAIEDFEANLDWINRNQTKAKFTQESLDKLKQVRQDWLNDLRVGRNPLKSLTPEEIEEMSQITSK